MHGARPLNAWTSADVERQLIEVFRLLPHCPVYSRGPAIRTPWETCTAVTDVLEWAGLLAGDSDGRKYLLAWARCRATRSSFGELCRGMGWPRATAEAGRRAALTIAAALARSDATKPGLDSGKTGGRPLSLVAA